MNYVMFGGTISFDISDLDDTTSITFGCSCVEGSTTKTYGASETALISVIKTWTSAHALTLPTISSRIDITCTDNKVTIQPYNNNGHTIQYSVFINS